MDNLQKKSFEETPSVANEETTTTMKHKFDIISDEEPSMLWAFIDYVFYGPLSKDYCMEQLNSIKDSKVKHWYVVPNIEWRKEASIKDTSATIENVRKENEKLQEALNAQLKLMHDIRNDFAEYMKENTNHRREIVDRIERIEEQQQPVERTEPVEPKRAVVIRSWFEWVCYFGW